MANMKEILADLVCAIVDHPDDVVVTEEENKGEVTLILDEETGASFKFVKVLDSWGIMCDNGNWEDFKNVKEKYLNCFYEAIRKVLD